jgi:hypothetical protein
MKHPINNWAVLEQHLGHPAQKLDFEPTGYTLEADATGGTATTLIDAQFQTWGIAAGDPLYNVSEQVLTEVVSVDSQTRLPYAAAVSTRKFLKQS